MVILHGSVHFGINIKKILAKHKHVVPIIFQEEKEAYARPFLKKNHVLNIYQIISYKFLHLNVSFKKN